MAISGHKTEAIYWRYAMNSDGDIRDAGRKLERYFQEIRTVTKSVTDADQKAYVRRKFLDLLGWVVGFEPTATGTTIQRSTS